MKEISIEITHDCALKCIFCSSSAEHPSPLGELSLDKIKSIIDESILCGADTISISGGEPLLHRDIYEILCYCKQYNLNILLYCSGLIFDKHENRISVSKSFWKSLFTLLGDNITVIFDVQSCQKENAEFLNDIEDSFELIIESIKNAISVGLICETHIVPMKQNFKEIPSILEYCKSIGISKVSFLRFVPQGRGVDNLELLNLSEEEFLELQTILYEMKNKYDENFIRLGHPIDFLFCIDKKTEITPCRGGNDAPLVLPNGDVHMCPAWKQLKHLRAGNVFDNGLKEIWQESEFYIKFRELIDKPDLIQGQCGACKQLDKCKGGCTAQRILLFEKLNIVFPDIMYLSPDPYCPLVNNYNLKNSFEESNDKKTVEVNEHIIINTMILLHSKKTIMYGDAWKKRGEILSILSNISRKFDRLEKIAKQKDN